MTFAAHEFAWADAYVACRYTAVDDTNLLKKLVGKGVRAFCKGAKEKIDV